MHFAFLGWSITNMISLAIYIVSAFAFYKLGNSSVSKYLSNSRISLLNNPFSASISSDTSATPSSTIQHPSTAISATSRWHTHCRCCPSFLRSPTQSLCWVVWSAHCSACWFISVRCWFICSFSSSMHRRTNFYSPSFR